MTKRRARNGRRRCFTCRSDKRGRLSQPRGASTSRPLGAMQQSGARCATAGCRPQRVSRSAAIRSLLLARCITLLSRGPCPPALLAGDAPAALKLGHLRRDAMGPLGYSRGCPRARRTEMDARVKGCWLIGVVGHGGGCAGGRATVAAATTTVTLRCAGRDRRTVSGRELPRTLIASRDRIVLIEVPPAGRGGRLAPSVESFGQAASSWRTGWLVVAAQRNPVSSRAIATVAMVGRFPCEVRCL